MAENRSGRSWRPRENQLEVFAAILLGLATIGSAWCALEAARWHDRQGDATRDATKARIEAARGYNLGILRIAYDAMIAAQYAEAAAEGQTDLRRFYRDALIRQEFLPTIDAWLAQVQSGQTGAANLFEHADYLEQQLAETRELDAAEAATERGDEASAYADGYIQVTVFMAIALFFAGIKSNFGSASVQTALVTIAALLVVFGGVQIVGLPIA